jgi:gluconokinase
MPKKTADGILALDIGTSSVRAVVYDTAGRMLPNTLCDLPYRLDTRLPGQASSKAGALLELVFKSIDTALKDAQKDRIDIQAVAASCYWHSLMGVDAGGRPTTELFTWADTRSSPQAEKLRLKYDERSYHALTGCFFHASYWPAKLQWLRATRPTAFRQTVAWISLAEYLYEHLFGKRLVSISMASGTGLLDLHQNSWAGTALQLSGIAADNVSGLSDWDQPMTGLRPVFGSRWPQLKSIPWFLPIGDGAAANVGADCVGTEWFCATIGTSGALRVILSREGMKIPWGTWAYRLDRGHLVLGGALSEGGNVIRWLFDLLGLKRRKAENAASKVPPDGHGLTILPFWAGERSPNWRGDARAAIVGLSLSTTAAQIIRAAMESITYRFMAVYDVMLRTVSRPRAVMATGGKLVHSPLWAQMLADGLGTQVMISPEPESSSRGAALLALSALGLRPNLWKAKPASRKLLKPRRPLTRIYRSARAHQEQLEALIVPPKSSRGRTG